MNINPDLETLKKARPYLRTILAILFKLNRIKNSVEEDYKLADVYLRQLEKDIKDQ